MNSENLSAIAAKLCVSEQPSGCHPLHLTISERAAEKLNVGPEEKGVVAALERPNNNNDQITLFVSVRITGRDAELMPFLGLKEDPDLQEHQISLWCTPQFLDHYKIMKNDLYFISTVEVFPIQKVIFEVTTEEAFRWTNKVKFGAELIVSICQGNVLIRQGDVFLAPFSTLLLQDKDFKENMVFDIRVIECHPVKQGILTVNTQVVFILSGSSTQCSEPKNNQAQSPVEQSIKNAKACTPCISDFSQPLNGLRSKSMNGGMLKGHSDAASASRENLRSGCVQFVSHKSFTVQPTVLMKENLLECMVRSQDENSSFDPLYVIGMSRCLMLEYGIFDGAIVYVSISGPENAGDQVPVFVQFKNSRCLQTFPRSGHSEDHGSDVDSLPDEEIRREDTNTEGSTTVNCNVRLAQVKMLKEEFNMSSDVYVSPLLLFNLQPSPTTEPMQVCVLEKFSNRQSDDSVSSVSSSWDAKIPFAKEVQISLVNSPNYSPLSSYTDAIKNYFHSVTRVVSVGDVFAVKSEDDPQFYSSLSDDIESRHPLIYFKMIRIEPELPGHRTFIVDDVKTTLIQVGSVHSYIPSQLEVYLSRHPSLRYWDRPKLGGLEASSDRLESLLLPHLSSSYEANRDILPCILLTGPSGVGKSAVVKCVARKLGLKVVRVSCSNLSADTPSATEARLKRVMESATFYSPCVLLLQQIHVLGVEREGNMEDTRVAKGFQDMLSLLVPAEYPVVVIATTAQPKLMSEDIQQCFLHTLNMEVPSESERADMIGSLLSDTDVASDIDVATIAQRTAGFVLGDFLALLVQVKKCAINRICEYCGVCPTMERERDVRSAGVAVDQSDVDHALEVLQSTHSHAIGTPKIPDVRWEDIGGLAEVREEILDTVQLPLQHPELLAAGLRRSGVLLYGPPGSGKTLLAKAVATECSLNFLSVKGPELINKYVGQSEENVREVFSRARDASPCVIFFDELDSLAPNRGRSGDSGGVMDRVVSQMLAELDGLHRSLDVFMIGATNRPDLLDPALLRPGRFDKPLYLGVSSDKATQVKILQALTRKFSLDPALSLEEVAADCPMTLTGADFYALCSDAMLNALKRKINRLERGEAVDQGTVTVLQADFTAALSKLTPSVSGEDLQRYEQLKISLSANT